MRLPLITIKLRKMFSQHFPKFNGDEGESALAEHHIQEHGGEAPDFRMSIIHRGGGIVLRKCLEAVEIHLRDPVLNRRMEGSGAMDLYF